MKTVATFTRAGEAQVLKLRLEAVGIPAYLQDETLLQLNVFYSNAIGGVKVQVADEDYESALRFLQEDKGVGSADA